MVAFWMPVILAAFAGFMWCAAYQHTRTALSRRPVGFNHLVFALWATLAALLATGNLFFYLDLTPAQYLLLSRLQVLVAIATVTLFLLFTVRYFAVPLRGFISGLLLLHGLLFIVALSSEGGGFSQFLPEDIHRATHGLMQGRTMPSRIVLNWPAHVYNALIIVDFAVAFYWGIRRYEQPDTRRASSFLLAVGLYFIAVVIEGTIYAITGQLSNISLMGVGSMVLFMGGSLSSAERESEVMAMNRVLEQRIAERTAEVEQAVHTLSAEMREKDALHAQLLQSQKMEAVGQLAGSFAHDFNNVLTAIRAYSELAYDQTAAGTEAHDYLAQVLAGADRGAQLTAQLQGLVQQQRANRQPCQLDAWLADYVARHPLQPAARIHLVLAMADNLPPVQVDIHQLGQVLRHLLQNAVEAMPDGGELSLSLRAASGVAVPSALPPGDYLCLRVADTGAGIEPALQQTIFEPFFTSRPQEKAGLGLTLCRSLLKLNDGHLLVSSQPGQGARFDIYLPARG